MTSISLPIYSFIQTLFNSVIIFKCMKAFFPSKERKPKSSYVLWILYYLYQYLLGVYVPFSPTITLVINAFFVCILCITTFDTTFRRCLTFTVLICSIWMLIEVILFIYLSIFDLEATSIPAGSIISKIIMLLFSSIIGRLDKKGEFDLPIPQLLMLLAIPLGSIYLTHNLFVISEKHTEFLNFSFLAGLLLILMNYIILEVYEWLAQKSQYERKTLLFEQQLELCNKQVEEREVSNGEIQKLKHDIKNHLIVLLGMIQQNDSDNSANYIHNILHDTLQDKSDDISNSGNIVIDSLVNYQYKKAMDLKIDFKANIIIPYNLPYQAGHLTVILGNLLENAFDACQSIIKGERYIELNIKYAKEVLIIMVQNTYQGKRITGPNGTYLTTKKDSKNHGIGLSSIECALLPYHGQLIVEDFGSYFTSTIIMYKN